MMSRRWGKYLRKEELMDEFSENLKYLKKKVKVSQKTNRDGHYTISCEGEIIGLIHLDKDVVGKSTYTGLIKEPILDSDRDKIENLFSDYRKEKNRFISTLGSTESVAYYQKVMATRWVVGMTYLKQPHFFRKDCTNEC